MKTYAIITGASRGIGRSIALALAADGYNLILLSSKDLAGLKETAAMAQRPGFDIRTYLVDVSKPGDVNDFWALEELKSIWSDVRVLVNNAGIDVFNLVQDITDAEWDRIMDTNIGGVFRMCRGVVPHMLHSHSGTIINISSYWGIHGAAMESAYCASKGAVNAFSLSLADELAFSGIRVNALACEYIDTAMNAGFTPEEIEDVLKIMPSRRVISPDEVGRMVACLARSGCDISGRVLSMNEMLELI